MRGIAVAGERRLQVPSPGALKPVGVHVLASRASGDRAIEFSNLKNLGTQLLVLTPSADGGSVEVQGAAGARFDLNLRGPVGNGEAQSRYAGVAVQAGARNVVAPESWGNLGAAPLMLDGRALEGNPLQQQIRLPRQ